MAGLTPVLTDFRMESGTSSVSYALPCDAWVVLGVYSRIAHWREQAGQSLTPAAIAEKLRVIYSPSRISHPVRRSRAACSFLRTGRMSSLRGSTILQETKAFAACLILPIYG
jgi:hypothetical protein